MNESFLNPSALPPRIIWRTDGKEMVLVPSGPFVLGIDNPLRGQDGPAHTVTLPA